MSKPNCMSHTDHIALVGNLTEMGREMRRLAHIPGTLEHARREAISAAKANEKGYQDAVKRAGRS